MHSSLLLPVPPGKPLCQAIHLMLPIQTNLSHLNQYTNKHLLNCTFSKSLSNQYLGMSHLKKCKSPLKIFFKKKTLHEIPSPEDIVCKGCFSNSTPFLVLIFQMIHQYLISHDTTLKPPIS